MKRKIRWRTQPDGTVELDQSECYPETNVWLKPHGNRYTFHMSGERATLTGVYKSGRRMMLSLQAAKGHGERIAHNLKWVLKATGVQEVETYCFGCSEMANFTVDYEVMSATCIVCRHTKEI